VALLAPRTTRGEECVVFAGDLSLSRGVAREVARRGSPWPALRQRLGPRDHWIANLEGALEVGRCATARGPCLGFTREDLRWLRGVFAAVSLANNHADDFGAEGRRATEAALAAEGVAALREEAGPQLLRLGGREWAFVAVNLVNRSGEAVEAALLRARLQIGLARASTPRVVVLPHWGREHDGRVWALQERAAELFRAWGALLVVGSHVHRPQEVRVLPEESGPARVRSRAGTLVHFGLGDHLFDLGPPASPEAGLLRCCPVGEGLRCAPSTTRRPPGSSLPRLEGSPGPAVTILPDGRTDTAWQRHPARERFLFVQPCRTLGPGHFFALHRRYSTFDREEALRPYLFRLRPGERPLDRWRGTALARPLLAARLILVRGRELLCAIHRGDSFIEPRPATRERTWRVYVWAPMGFRSVEDPEALDLCRGL